MAGGAGNFRAPVARFVRLGLTMAQVRDRALDIERLGIAVKPSDSRTRAISRPTATAAGRPMFCWPPSSSGRSMRISGPWPEEQADLSLRQEGLTLARHS